MAASPKVSLVISTYKSPHFLNLVLASVSRQKVLPVEVIVTEDGEFSENEALVNKWRAKFNFPLIHVTQKDIGNRKPLALNKAILKASGDYLIFIDGDCILRNDFIWDHLQERDEKSFITGRRVELSKMASTTLTEEKILRGYLDHWPLALIWDGMVGETFHWARFFKTPKVFRGLFLRNKIDDIRGCNFSVSKKDMVAINGFNNEFSGAYGEDSDVECRLSFLGLKMKSIRGAAIQYHLWHKPQVKDESNQDRLTMLRASGVAKTENGLNQAGNIL